jgi:protein pelota
MGAYHTLDLELKKDFTLHKDFWDSVALDRVNSACDPTQYADVGAVVMQEGLAHICLITSTMTIVRQKIEVAIPRKRRGSAEGHEKVKRLLSASNFPRDYKNFLRTL